MSLVDRSTADPSDAELISRVRGGDLESYGLLFSRHVEAANRLAHSLVRGPDADDLVSEAFSKVLNVLLKGGGPDLAFRAYLLTAVRRVHVDRIRGQQRAVPTEDLGVYDDGEPFRDTVVAGFEGGAAARAFRSLPERWQMVLWHLEVEGQKPAQIAPLLGMSANSVSALAYRAREGLRQAFLQMHAADIVDDGCAWTHDQLGAYVRGGLSRRDTDKVERHLDTCRRCTALYLELLEVNSSLAAVLGPLVLGSASVAYLAATSSGAGAGAGLLALFGRVRDTASSHGPTVLVGSLAVGVAGAAVAGALALTRGGEQPASDGPVASSVAPRSTPAPSPSTGPSHRTPARHHPRQHRTPRAAAQGQDHPSPGSTATAADSGRDTSAPSTRRTTSNSPGRPSTPRTQHPSDHASPPQPPNQPPNQSPKQRPPKQRPPKDTGPPPPPPTSPAPVSVSIRLTTSPLGLQVAVTGLPPAAQAQITVEPLGHKGRKKVERAPGGNGTTAIRLRGIRLPLRVVVHIPGQQDTVLRLP